MKTVCIGPLRTSFSRLQPAISRNIAIASQRAIDSIKRLVPTNRGGTRLRKCFGGVMYSPAVASSRRWKNTNPTSQIRTLEPATSGLAPSKPFKPFIVDMKLNRQRRANYSQKLPSPIRLRDGLGLTITHKYHF